jgi:hypothetical protein
MKKAVAAVLACLAPSFGLAATMTGSTTVSSAAVDLPAVGTFAWARWPNYSHMGSAISNVTTTGTFKTHTNNARLIGDRSGIKVAGPGASFEFTVAATTTERTLTYYVGGWNSTGRVTVTLPGAASYTVTFSSSTTFSRVITVRYRADAAATLRVNYTQTAGSGSINMQAAALVQAATPQTNGSTILTWQPPAANEDGSTLTDLAGYRVYWGTTPGTYSRSTQLNPTSRTHTVTGLARGTWYFVVTALNSQGVESSYSNVWSKTVP